MRHYITSLINNYNWPTIINFRGLSLHSLILSLVLPTVTGVTKIYITPVTVTPVTFCTLKACTVMVMTRIFAQIDHWIITNLSTLTVSNFSQNKTLSHGNHGNNSDC